MKIQDITPGESWACRFRTVTFVDAQGTPVSSRGLQVGQAHPGTPEVYESIGVIQVRDQEQRVVQLQDTVSLEVFTVSYDDCWDVDTVEWEASPDE